MERPIFYDVTGRRDRRTMRGFLALLVGVLIAVTIFAGTVINVPVPAPLSMAMERPLPRPLSQQVAHLRHHARHGLHSVRDNLASWLPGTAQRGNPHPLSVGFYVPWDDASKASLARHIGQIDWLVPSLYSVTGPDHRLVVTPDHPLDALLAATAHKPAILPMVQNAVADRWDGAGAAALLRDKPAQAAFFDRLDQALDARHAAGAVFDFEELPLGAQQDYLAFLKQAHARLAAEHRLLAVTVPAEDEDWNLAAYSAVTDRVILMAYDEHSPASASGPITGQDWFVQRMSSALEKIPADRLIVGIANYAYDWIGPADASTSTIEEAWLIAHDSGVPVRFDRASGNETFDYEDNGIAHTVWMADAATAWNQLRAANAKGVAGVALWRLGSEDAGYWKALAASRGTTPPDLRTMVSVGNVDVEGNGEILRIADVPTPGRRALVKDDRGLFVDESYQSLPTPYVVWRWGNHPKEVALTFDDGPDPQWTPKILSILKQKGVPGTFFIIGENAIDHPWLIREMAGGSNEVGSHTFTHPNLSQESVKGTEIELNATQRVIEAWTGRSARLFRAPYFGDAEPTTADELVPALAAQRAGYTNVGLHVDPGDWARPGVEQIVAKAVSEVEKGTPQQSERIVLLHDGGGDRSQTVAALPRIIDALKARGYRFVPVSQLAGLTRDQVMPKVSGGDLMAVRADVSFFLFFAAIEYIVKWLFFAAIALGIARAVILAALAVDGARPRNRPQPPRIDPGQFISVLIPAFNEARVIEASVRRVLASEQVAVEVIVIDDGSQDATSAIVTRAFADEPRVTLLTLENGGKARALNQGLQRARGEIVIALDADTQFEPLTIARLARWFADPQLGAVAGNAKVGNRVNLVTRWQAVEYVTAQNLERRALARLGGMMVVPGAVGAWRKAALDSVGGYPTDTLAEDQDLTIAIQRQGWTVACDMDAVAWTEAPESFRALAKQRFRWAFGTLQCLWKHRAILESREPAGLAFVGMPQAWIFQIGFALISPLIDLALVTSIIATIVRVNQHGWAQTQSDVLRMAVYWIAFTAIDVICGWVAYRLEQREQRYPALLLVAQRLVYRQIMYSVVVRAVANALRGLWVGWGKLERSGRVSAAPAANGAALPQT
jgi:peptidoglycan/xylan/chitin deacetylase (PgdA/CDA1 family)/spore germination protein YaaH/GT2 family glycosyltransferase